jgi:hypothetical protein
MEDSVGGGRLHGSVVEVACSMRDAIENSTAIYKEESDGPVGLR